MVTTDIPMVMYHSVNDRPGASPMGFLSLSTVEFREHLKYFRRNGYRSVTLPELWELAGDDRLGSEKTVLLSFDDGYLDNLLFAEEILKEFDARATLFVTVDFVGEGVVRSCDDVPSGWGYLNEAELRALQRRGTFDIQCHTMTHNMEFCSDRVVDFYRPEVFDRFYWLTWLLDPAGKPRWLEHVDRARGEIPIGYPIFEHDRAICARRFTPSESFVTEVQACYAKQGVACLEEVNAIAGKGSFETEEQHRDRVTFELSESKKRLEGWLNKPVDFVCFPGGGYDAPALEIAGSCGYKAYMVRSSERRRGNIERIMAGVAGDQMVALSRISISKDYPGLLSVRRSAYWSCKIAVETFLDRPPARAARAVGKAARSLLRAVTGKNRSR